MLAVVRVLVSFLPTTLRSRASLQTEILALRHQLSVVQRSASRPRLQPSDRVFWAWLSRVWNGCRIALVIVLCLMTVWAGIQMLMASLGEPEGEAESEQESE